MIRPCPTAVRCFPCADGNPLANLSSELPDTNLFLSVQFRRLPNPPHNNWNQVSCVGFCESTISQVDADDCARRQAFECILDGQPPPNPDNPTWPTPFYCNQTATFQSGSNCYTIAAGTVCAFTQAEANALAESLGNHRVHDSSLTSPCPPVISPPLAPEPDCPAETGTAAPNTLEISSEKLWEIHAVNHDTLVDYDLVGCTSTGLGIFEPVLPLDHPPGNYGLKYLSGLIHFLNPAYCTDPEFPYYAAATVHSLQNEEHNYSTEEPCHSNPHHLAASFNPGTGLQGCFEDVGTATGAINAALLADTFTSVPYPPDEVTAFAHSNDGGSFSIMQFGFGPEGDLDVEYPSGAIYFQVVQLGGLIPQPRKVAIANYAELITEFADPAAAAAWNGEFPERTVYNAMTVQWAATAAGAFGGALLRFTDAHPTSANGKGWMLDIFSAGAILMWRGFKAVGADSIGRYYRDSTSTSEGPVCLTCVDDSDTAWEPP